MGWWSEASQALLSLALPWACPICGADDREGRSGPFCVDCRDELLDAAGPACRRCAMPVGPHGSCRECRGRRPGFDAAVAVGPYAGPLRALCLRLKHQPSAWLARWVAELIVEARPWLAEEAARTPAAVLVPVPLHWRRRAARGYNQSDDLARGLAGRLGLARTDVLRRDRPTAHLVGMGRADRARQLRGAFSVHRQKAAAMKGRTVFLVDDVLTTGATCGAAARALKQAGARRVVAVVVARAQGRA